MPRYRVRPAQARRRAARNARPETEAEATLAFHPFPLECEPHAKALVIESEIVLHWVRVKHGRRALLAAMNQQRAGTGDQQRDTRGRHQPLLDDLSNGPQLQACQLVPTSLEWVIGRARAQNDRAHPIPEPQPDRRVCQICLGRSHLNELL